MPHRKEQARAGHDRECEVVVETLVLDARHRVAGRSFTEVSELAADLEVATFPT